MPAGDIPITQRPGQVPGTSVVTGANGEEITIPSDVAESVLSRPDFTSADVAGETAAQLTNPADEMAAALGYEQDRSPEDMAAALGVADQAIQLAEEQAQAEDELATLAYVGSLPAGVDAEGRAYATLGLTGAPSVTEAEEDPNTYASTGISTDDVVAELEDLRGSGGETAGPAVTGIPSSRFQDPSGRTRVRGATFDDPAERPRRGRSPVSATTTLTRNYDIVDVDPELEANARMLEDQLRNTLASVHLREASFQGELAGLEASVADDLLQDREEIAAIANQAAVRQREGLETLGELNESVMNRTINPERFFTSRGGAARFSAAASVALGTLSQALAPGMQNTAMAIIDNAIQRDIDAQVSNLRNANLGVDRQRGLLQDLRNVFGDELQARQALRSMYITEAQRRIQALAAQATSEKEVLAGRSLVEDLAAERARTDADLAARAGTVNMNEVIRVRGAANSRRVQRQVTRMSVQSPAQRSAINYRRVMQGLPPLEAPAAPARPTPARGPRGGRPRGPRGGRPPAPTTQEQAFPDMPFQVDAEGNVIPRPTEESSEARTSGRRINTRPVVIDSQVRRTGSGENAVEFHYVREPQRTDDGRFVVRNAETGETGAVGPRGTIPEGFEQVYGERRAEQIPVQTVDVLMAESAASTPIPIGGGRSIPSAIGSTPDQQRRAQQWAAMDPQDRRASIERLQSARRARANLRRLSAAYAQSGWTQLKSDVDVQVTELFSVLDTYGRGSDALGIIGPTEVEQFAVANPATRYSAELKQRTIAIMNRIIREGMEQELAWQMSVPNAELGTQPPSSAQRRSGRGR